MDSADRTTPGGARRAMGEAYPRERSIVFSYTNHRGETGVRTAVPIRLRWGTDEWYPEPCWLLDAFDLDRQAERTFALLKMGSVQGPKSDEPLMEVFARLREAGGDRWDDVDDVPAYLGHDEPGDGTAPPRRVMRHTWTCPTCGGGGRVEPDDLPAELQPHADPAP